MAFLILELLVVLTRQRSHHEQVCAVTTRAEPNAVTPVGEHTQGMDNILLSK